VISLGIELSIDILVGAAFLWIGMKFTARVIAGMPPGASYCSWGEILLASIGAALINLLPGILGWLLSWLVLFVMLIKFTGGTVTEVAIIVFFSRVAALIASIWLIPFLL
jgi:hypothetical protein